MGVTINDVAKAANVSKATVSRFLNNKSCVSAETAEKITQVIEELKYIPNATARNLALKQTDQIGLLISGLNTSYWGRVYGAMCERLSYSGDGYEVITVNSDSMILYNSHKRLQDKINLVAEMRVAGIILAMRESLITSDAIDHLHSLDIPFVVVQSGTVDDPRINFVNVDNFAASYGAAKYLLEKNHVNIAYVSGPGDASYALERFEGYKRAMLERGLFTPRNVLQGNSMQHDGYWRTKQILSWPPNPEKGRVSAIMYGNDLMAYGGMQAILEAGLSIPEDISIIGFDALREEIEIYDMLPPLTTVHQPMELIGIKTAEVLLRAIRSKSRGKSKPYHVFLATKFIDRGSCRALPAD